MKDELNVYEYAIGEGLRTYYNPLSNPTPLHPDIIEQLSTEFKIGDLVETHLKQIGIIQAIASQYEEGPIYISGANNTQYIVLVDGTQNILVGYSLKKL